MSTATPSDLPRAPGMVRIRQVALCTDDIWPAEQQIVAELGVSAVHRDPPNVFEMRNVVFAVGDTFLEVLQPTAPTAPSARFLTRRGGPGGYMLILQVDDLDRARARVDALGIRVAHAMPMADVHGVRAGALHLHPSDTGGTLISLDQMDPVDGWAWAGRAWRGHMHTGIASGIVGASVASADPDGLAARLALLLGRPVGPERTIAVDGGAICIVDVEAGDGDHLRSIDVTAGPDGKRGTVVTVAGTDINLV